MKTCKVKALALAVAYAFTATGSVSAADMQSGKDPMSLMSANSFSVSAPGESRLQYFRRDLIKLLEPYKDKTLSPKKSEGLLLRRSINFVKWVISELP